MRNGPSELAYVCDIGRLIPSSNKDIPLCFVKMYLYLLCIFQELVHEQSGSIMNGYKHYFTRQDANAKRWNISIYQRHNGIVLTTQRLMQRCACLINTLLHITESTARPQRGSRTSIDLWKLTSSKLNSRNGVKATYVDYSLQTLIKFSSSLE